MTTRPMVTLSAGLLLVLGAAAWIGVAVAQKDAPREGGADKPDFKAWTYPGAKELGSGQGGGRVPRDAGHD